jgi:MFS family permease
LTPPARFPWRLVAALAGLNVLSFVDRQLLAAVAPVLIDELGLSRAQIGLLIGVAFILVYSLGTLGAGALADRVSRPRLMAGGLAAWSAATALTGTASGFASLAVWRSLVGIGEATLPAPALAMIGDRVPPQRLGLASGIFYAGIPVGFAVSFALAGAVVPAFGWRACFLALGVAGLGSCGARPILPGVGSRRRWSGGRSRPPATWAAPWWPVPPSPSSFSRPPSSSTPAHPPST